MIPGTRLSGKVALVTGAARGIGRAIAERLGAEGAAVAVNYVRSEAAASEVVEAITAWGSKAAALQADVSQVAEVRRLFAEVLERFGRLDILVNNAGDAEFGPLSEVSEAAFDRLFALNVKGVFFAIQEAARHMADGGRIVNLSSGITVLGGAGGALYAGTKGAVEQFTQCAARELGGRGITVNTVSPGPTETDLLLRAVPPEARESLAKTSPLGRVGQPRDIADVVAFMVSDEARWLTALNVRANGGAA